MALAQVVANGQKAGIFLKNALKKCHGLLIIFCLDFGDSFLIRFGKLIHESISFLNKFLFHL